MPKISVIMSVYKEPIEWLRQSINSILGQTYSDFEFIIICDNPNYEEGIALLKNYANKDSRIKILSNEINIGLTKSLNRGLDIAQGDYIARMDADDISFPDRFAFQLGFMESHPNCVASGGFAKIINEKGDQIGKWKTRCLWRELRSSALFISPILHPTAFFKRIILDTPVRYDETMRYAQDYALWGSLIGEHEILNCDRLLLYYRQTQGQISSNHYEEQANCAIQTQSVLFEKLNLIVTPEIKKAVALVTKKQKEESSVELTYNSLITFANENNGKDTIDMSIVKTWLFNCFAQYLRYHCGFVEANKYIIAYSKAIGCFNMRAYLVLNYNYLRKRVA